MTRSMGEVVTSRSRHRNHFSQRVAPGLSCFGLDGVEDPGMEIQNQVVKTTDCSGSFIEGQPFPGRLRIPRARYRFANLCGRRNLYAPNNFSRCRITDFDNVSLSSRNYAMSVALL